MGPDARGALRTVEKRGGRCWGLRSTVNPDCGTAPGAPPTALTYTAPFHTRHTRIAIPTQINESATLKMGQEYDRQ